MVESASWPIPNTFGGFDERLPAAEGGSIPARRSLHYGPSPMKDTAELEIEQFKKDSAASQGRFSALKTAWSDAAIN